MNSSVKVTKPIVEASLADKECEKLADELAVKITPSVFYFEGTVQKEKIVPDEKLTWNGAQQMIEKLAGLPT